MTDSYKILGKLAPSDSNNHIIYTCPAKTETLVSNITVTNRTNSAQVFDIISTNRAFLAAGQYSPGLYSTDFINWQSSTLAPGYYWDEAAFASDKVVIINSQGNNNLYQYSTDLINWSNGTFPDSDVRKSIIYLNGSFYVLGSNGKYLHSTDAVTWTTSYVSTSDGAIFYVKKFYYVNGIVFATYPYMIQEYLYSTDMISWSTGFFPSAPSYGMAYGNGSYVVLGWYGSAYISTDNVSWQQVLTPMGTSTSLAFGANQFVATNQFDYNVYMSTDGITWLGNYLYPSFGQGNYYGDMNYTDGLFIASGSTQAGTFIYSTDASTWNASGIPGVSFNGSALIFYNKLASGYLPPKDNQYIYKSYSVPANQSVILKPGISMSEHNALMIKGTSNLTFSAYGVEIS